MRPRRHSVWTLLLIVVLGIGDLGLVGAAAYQRWGPAPVPGAAASTPSSATTEEPAASAGDVLLDVGANGQVLRAVRGACDGDTGAASVELVSPAGRLTPLTTGGLADVVDVDAGSPLQVTGADEQCRTVAYRVAGGQMLRESKAPSGYRLSEVRSSSQIVGDRGPIAIPDSCTPLDVVSVGDSALVGCDGGDVWSLEEGSWRRRDAIPGLVQLRPREGGGFYALTITAQCSARLIQTSELGTPWTQTACLAEHGAGVALGARGKRVAVQVGRTLLTSSDAGRTFREVSSS